MPYILSVEGVLNDELDGPLAAHMASFGKWVSEAGYSFYSTCSQVRLVGFFSRWLSRKKIRLTDLCAEHVDGFLRYRARTHGLRSDHASLMLFIHYLRSQKILPALKTKAARLSAADQCAQAYEQYLRAERGVTTACVINYVPFVREFLERRFGKGRVTLSELCAGDVVSFVHFKTRHLHIARTKLLVSALRSFLRYTRYRGESTLDLAAAVPSVANWSRPMIPRAIQPDQVRRLLASVDRSTPVGSRDYAILLLLARLGLRSSEIVYLELEDIDWEAGSLHVHTKSDRQLVLPLPADVGKAIAAYLQHGRPRSTSRRVFLRAKAPIRGFFSRDAVSSIVKSSLARAGIVAATNSTHQFRHGLASEMLRLGASLSEIGALLGHRHPDTTRVYAKVDINALRALALPWPVQ
jgi:integrase/recombinase XerD